MGAGHPRPIPPPPPSASSPQRAPIPPGATSPQLAPISTAPVQGPADFPSIELQKWRWFHDEQGPLATCPRNRGQAQLGRGELGRRRRRRASLRRAHAGRRGGGTPHPFAPALSWGGSSGRGAPPSSGSAMASPLSVLFVERSRRRRRTGPFDLVR
ncbi:hypothetical protein EJB05_21846, partial [Eragrostis curvula]